MSAPFPNVTPTEPTYIHVDDIEWTPVQRQRNADGTESVVRERWPIMRTDFLSAYVRYEPGMVVRRHGHRSNHVVFVLAGGVWLAGCGLTLGALTLQVWTQLTVTLVFWTLAGVALSRVDGLERQDTRGHAHPA